MTITVATWHIMGGWRWLPIRRYQAAAGTGWQWWVHAGPLRIIKTTPQQQGDNN